jgi:putative endonuclease
MNPSAETRRNRGAMSCHAGLLAEECISKDHERSGFSIAQRCWRGKRGEIDLIVQDGDGLVFVEVKQQT